MLTVKGWLAWTLVVATVAVGIPATSAVAANGSSELLVVNGSDGSSHDMGLACSSCIGGLETTCCGDMSPTAMLPGARWYFQADLIALRRDATKNEDFQSWNANLFTLDDGAVITTPISETVLSTDQLHFQNQAGHQLLLGYMISDCYALEFSYFDLHDWEEIGAVRDNTEYVAEVDGDLNPTTTYPNSLFSPFSDFGNPPIEGVDYNRFAQISYRSSLDNVELNVRHWLRKRPSRLAISVLWGGRHNAVHEQFGYLTESVYPGPGVISNAVNVRTRNELWAFQVGSLLEFCVDPGWHLEYEVKGGIAHNRAFQESVYTVTGGENAGVYTGRADKDLTSWVASMRLDLVYQFGAHLTTHIGYQALFLGDLALASRNMQTDLDMLMLGPAMLNDGGHVIYHGPEAGFVVTW
ncbi:MAG: hypothetical protein GXY25_11980 [Pirellulaceae bacterium]|jgi:hypothetical protein|nr:hypothetical protein [Thermoguttaceae bacterium]NLZ01244.1 hypothetical protein [Pirellulaceae bacterium]